MARKASTSSWWGGGAPPPGRSRRSKDKTEIDLKGEDVREWKLDGSVSGQSIMVGLSVSNVEALGFQDFTALTIHVEGLLGCDAV
jgi:hypothetical protein